MSGNKRVAIVIQPRDEHLLRELALMRVIDREQAKLVAGFHSTTRANARLLALYRAGLVRRFFQGTTAGGKKALYTLSPKGARVAGTHEKGLRHRNGEVLSANFFVAHQLAVNEIYCAVKYRPFPTAETRFVRWVGFSRPIAPGISLIPDGYFELGTAEGVLAAFLEVDLGNERPPVWKAKAETYLRYAAAGNFRERFEQQRFRVAVVANTERRMQAIRGVVQKLTDKIFWFSTFDAIERHGLCGAGWLRPAEDRPRSLL